jgi:hypothetical protein
MVKVEPPNTDVFEILLYFKKCDISSFNNVPFIKEKIS